MLLLVFFITKIYFSGELEADHKEKVTELEQKINIKLKERQEIFNQVFQQDMQQYIISGIIPVMKSSSEYNILNKMILNYKEVEMALYR